MGARPEINRLLAHGRKGSAEDRARSMMCARLRADGVRDEPLLTAMANVPRHQFIESALSSRAYQDVALPIGHGQTISKPSIVARMIELALMPVLPGDRDAARVLEIGTGCGYQAAVLAELVGEVVSIERIQALHRQAQLRLNNLELQNVRLVYGDGHEGLINSAPFHAIVLAAALDGDIPEALLHLMRVGARLVAPWHIGDGQRLVMIERTSSEDWQLCELDTVRFVPMLAGVQ